MADWVHCNKCYIRFKENVKFSIALCYHVFCEKCCSKIVSDKCILCNKPVRLIPLNKDTSADIQKLFLPLEEDVKRLKEESKRLAEDSKRVAEESEQLQGVYGFQLKQRQSLQKNSFVKYNNAKTELMRFYRIATKLKQENDALKTQLNNVLPSGYPPSDRSGGFSTSTPMVFGSIQSNNSLVGAHRLTPIIASNTSNYFNRNLNPNPHWPGVAQRMKPSEMDNFKHKITDSGSIQMSAGSSHRSGMVPVHNNGHFYSRPMASYPLMDIHNQTPK